MVRHIAIEAKATEPAVCQIEMDLIAQPPLRANAEAIADDQHPDHQFGIDRRAPHRAVERRQLSPQLTKLHEPIDRAQQMIGWYVPDRAKTRRTTLPVRFFDVPSLFAVLLLAATESANLMRRNSRVFYTKSARSGGSPRCSDTSAVGTQADMPRTS
jgi:hypothetical protein